MKQKLLDIAHIMDAYRVFPKLFMCVYLTMLYDAHLWYMTLPDPSHEQQLFVNVMWSAAAVITGFYVGTGYKWSR